MYYTHLNGTLTISDSVRQLTEKKASLHIDKNAAKEFLYTGFVAGEGTMIEHIYSLESATIYKFNKTAKSIDKQEYHPFHYKIAPRNIKPESAQDIYNTVFDDIIDVIKNKTVVIPLSGGYDSRLIVQQLHRLGIKDVICFTYGIANNYEAKVSKEVANYFDYPWIFIEYNEQKWKDLTVKHYLEEAFDYVSLPHIQDVIAVKELKEKKLIPTNSIFLPGHSGDFIAGSHLHRRLLNCKNEQQYKFELFWKHYTLNPILNIKRGLRLVSTQGYNDGGFPFPNRFEKWGIKERQSKFIVNSARVYEYFGFEWYMPLWDVRLVDFWLSVPIEQRLNRQLYFDYVSKFDPWYRPSAKVNRVGQLSYAAYYLKWLNQWLKNRSKDHHPMGWYSLIDKNTKFKSYGFFYSINSLLVKQMLTFVYRKLK